MSNNVNNQNEDVRKYGARDSLFTNLFGNKKYLLQLYQALHPEDTGMTEDQITNASVNNEFWDGRCSELGFMANDRLIIVMESHTVWTVNILVRAFIYIAEHYQDYLSANKISFYANRSREIQLPTPEIYVLYTGESDECVEELTLSKEFWGGASAEIEAKAYVMYDGKDGDIISQYVAFTKVCDEQRKEYGRTKKAILETIRICKDRNILKEYLEKQEKEVIDIMMVLYDEEKVLNDFIESEKYHAAKEATLQAARKMLKAGGFTVEQIAEFQNLTVEEVEALKKEM